MISRVLNKRLLLILLGLLAVNFLNIRPVTFAKTEERSFGKEENKRKKALEKVVEEVERLDKKYTSLQEEFEQLRKDFECYRQKVKKEKAQLYFKLGLAYLEAKLYGKAIRAYEHSLALFPNNPQANYHLGLLYEYVKDDSQKAVHYFKRYLELNPEAENREKVEELIRLLSAN